MAEGHDSFVKKKVTEPPGTPRSSQRCSYTPTDESPWRFHLRNHPPEQDEDEDSKDRRPSMQSNEQSSSRFYEELFCTSKTSRPLVPLAGTSMAPSGPNTGVEKEGYLGKLERNHRRYFVLRMGCHTGPSRLEWYKNQEKFTAMEKSAGKDSLFGTNKQGVIYLRCCLGVSRSGSSRKGHTVTLYDKDQTLVLVMEEQQQQEDWYLAIKRLMEEEQRDEEQEEGFDDDDGYCTLPPAAFFKEVWPVMVKPRGLGSSKPLSGENRLCLTASTLVLVRLGSNNDLLSVTIPLLSVRRFGHLDGFFFLELGRSAPHGPGEIWMEVKEEGNPALAQNIHEAVRETVRSLRALPDFSRSPTSSPNQQPGLLASKRCRPKQRDKLANVRAITSLVLHPRNAESQTSPAQYRRSRPQKADDTKSESSLSFTSHLSPPRHQQSSVPETKSCTIQSWESAEKEEGLGYVMMSPTVSNSLSELSQDDYVVMESPQKLKRPGYFSSSSTSSLQTSFSSSTYDVYSPLHPSRPQSNENGYPCSFSDQPPVDAQQDQNSDRSVLIPPFLLSGLEIHKPPQSGAAVDRCQPSHPQPVRDQSTVRRNWLPTCLLSCFQTGERS